MKKNLIILAAGKGRRLRPVTDKIPKPLVKINGVPAIENTIMQACAANIKEIIIVIGYKAEQFKYLESKYPNLRLVVNDEYATKNNISSLKAALPYLKNSYIADSDIIMQKNFFLKPIYETTYFTQFIEGASQE